MGQGDTPLFPLFSIFLTSLKQLFFQVNSMVILKIAKSPIGTALNKISFKKKSNMSITFCYLIYKVKAIEIKSMEPHPTHCTGCPEGSLVYMHFPHQGCLIPPPGLPKQYFAATLEILLLVEKKPKYFSNKMITLNNKKKRFIKMKFAEHLEA